MPTFIAAALILGLGVLGMSIAILLKKDGEFPKYDVGSNEQMRELGIRCFKDEDAALHGSHCTGNKSDACKECKLYESGSNSRPA